MQTVIFAYDTSFLWSDLRYPPSTNLKHTSLFRFICNMLDNLTFVFEIIDSFIVDVPTNQQDTHFLAKSAKQQITRLIELFNQIHNNNH